MPEQTKNQGKTKKGTKTQSEEEKSTHTKDKLNINDLRYSTINLILAIFILFVIANIAKKYFILLFLSLDKPKLIP